MLSAGRPHVPALDALRGAAIALVMICHLWVPALQVDAHLTYTGVDLFFVLSGYLIGGIVLRHKDDANFAMVFYGRRALRILPLYWLFLLAFAPTVAPQLGWLLTFTANIRWSFPPHYAPDWLAPIWSLCVEEQFYLVLPILLRLTPIRYIPHVLGAGIALGPLMRILVAIVCREPAAAYMNLPCRIDALFMGVVVAWGSDHLKSTLGLLRIAVLLGVNVALLALMRPQEGSQLMMSLGFTLTDAFYACVVALIVLHADRLRVPRPLAMLGVLAYPLYLFHSPLFDLASTFLPFHGVAAAITATVAVLALAIVLHRTIEQPAITFGRRVLTYKTSIASRQIPASEAA